MNDGDRQQETVPDQVARALAQEALGYAGRRAMSWGGAMLVRAGMLAGGKSLLFAGVVILALALLCGLLAIITAALGAIFQHTAAPWPAPLTERADGGYTAGGWIVTSPFGWRSSPFTGAPEFHDGIDIASTDGRCPFGIRCPLASMFDGTVRYVGWDQTGVADPSSTGGGQIVIVSSGADEIETFYAHLEPYRLHIQLQGRIKDPYGRYDDYADYGVIGDGELLPALDAATIELWCQEDMPRFQPVRSGATVTFLYDRPASCRASVIWPAHGDKWEGWIADDPPADAEGRATLAWTTPLAPAGGVDSAAIRRAGDVALRFRAHLIPPPPPPTATPVATFITDSRYPIVDMMHPASPALSITVAPVPTSVGESPMSEPAPPITTQPSTKTVSVIGYRLSAMNQGGMGQGWNLASADADDAPQVLCRVVGTETGCRWRVADIPLAMQPPAENPPATPTALSPQLSVNLHTSQYSAPVGGRFTLTVTGSRYPAGAQPIHLALDAGGMVKMLDVRTMNGSDCTGGGWQYTCTPGSAGHFWISFVVEVLPHAPKNGLITFDVTASADGAPAAHSQVIVEVAAYSVTPGPWPPPTLPPTQVIFWPTPVIIFPSPVLYPTTVSTPAPPPSSGPGMAPARCEPQALVTLSGVVNAAGGTGNMRLITPAAVSFAAVRAEIHSRTGSDPLARLADGLRPPEFRSAKPGVALMSWHMTGRAIDLDLGAGWRVVPEGRMYRVWLGGVDVTAIFERHGWNRIPAQGDVAEWWHYEYHPDGVSWAGAMLQAWPRPRLQAAFPQVNWLQMGCDATIPSIGLPAPLDAAICVPGSPRFAAAVEELPGCGPPLRAGDRVYQLDSIVGFVGTTGQTTGAHLHLGLRMRGYAGYAQTYICSPAWLQGIAPPSEASCWTDMADPLAFLPLAPPSSGDSPIIEGAPYQLPPPNHPGSLYRDPPPHATPVGQYWSPYADGGKYGGGRRGGKFLAHE